MHMMSVLIFMLIQTYVLALGCSEDEKGQVSNLRFSYYISFPWSLLGQGQVDFSC